MNAPVVVPHIEILLQDSRDVGQHSHVWLHAHEAYSVLLTSHLRNKVLIPAPEQGEAEALRKKLDTLPEDRQKRIELVDTDGTVLRRIERYLKPLSDAIGGDAADPSELHLYTSLGGFLYVTTIASRHRSAVFSRWLYDLHQNLAAVDLAKYDSETRHILAEVAGLAATYSPHQAPELEIALATSPAAIHEALDDILVSAEYERVVAESGRIGLVREPLVAFREVRRRLQQLIDSQKHRKWLHATERAAGFATHLAAGVELPQILKENGRDVFAPPFLSARASFQQVAYATTRLLPPDIRQYSGEPYVLQRNPFSAQQHLYPISPTPQDGADLDAQVMAARSLRARISTFA